MKQAADIAENSTGATQIEVTPEMIDAVENVLDGFDSRYCNRGAALDVIRALVQASAELQILVALPARRPLSAEAHGYWESRGFMVKEPRDA